MRKGYGQRCPVAKTLELVGDRWTLLLVRDLLRGACRFQDLQAGLPRLSPNMLSDQLKRMEKHGLVKRRFYSDHPPRAEYALTGMGQELATIVRALAEWGAHHVYKRARLVHADSGREVRLGYFRDDTGEPVPASAVLVRGGLSGIRRRSS